MFNLDPGKLIVIAVVAIILLGPDKLPQVARQVGGAWRSFGEFRRRMESEVRSTMPDLPPTSEIARLARSPAALLHHLSTMSEEEEAEAAVGEIADEAARATDATSGAGEANGAVGVPGVEDTSPPTLAPDDVHAGPTGPLAPTPGAHDTGTNGSEPYATEVQPPRPTAEPAVPADPNLN